MLLLPLQLLLTTTASFISASITPDHRTNPRHDPPLQFLSPSPSSTTPSKTTATPPSTPQPLPETKLLSPFAASDKWKPTPQHRSETKAPVKRASPPSPEQKTAVVEAIPSAGEGPSKTPLDSRPSKSTSPAARLNSEQVKRNTKSSPAPYTLKDQKHQDDNNDNDNEEDKETSVPTNTDDHNDDDNGPEFSFKTFIIIVVTILIVLANCAIIMVVAWTEAFSNFNKIFIYSLALSDLLIGLFITPYSIFLSVYRQWVFDSDVFCSVEAYVFTTLTSAKMYSLTWLNVDQYVAVRKPERYNNMMSPTRSLCWILFSWVVVISFCCPPLFSFESSIFDEASYLCMIDTKQQIAYVLTAGVLVCTPSMVATIITGAYLFTKSFKKQIQFYEKVFVDLCTRPWNYHITFTMSVVFLGVWFPFTCVYMIKYFLRVEFDYNLLFVLCWLGISTGFSQFIVLFVMSADFRRALKELVRFPEACRSSACMSGGDARSLEAGTESKSGSGGGGDGSAAGYITYSPAGTSQDTADVNVISASKSGSRGSGERRKHGHKSNRQSSHRSGRGGSNEASGSTSMSSLPRQEASGSGSHYRGSPAHV